jgi:hypothetical protein
LGIYKTRLCHHCDFPRAGRDVDSTVHLEVARHIAPARLPDSRRPWKPCFFIGEHAASAERNTTDERNAEFIPQPKGDMNIAPQNLRDRCSFDRAILQRYEGT